MFQKQYLHWWCVILLQTSAGGLEISVGNVGRVEACIHGLKEIFDDEKTEGIIQVDADKAFN